MIGTLKNWLLACLVGCVAVSGLAVADDKVDRADEYEPLVRMNGNFIVGKREDKFEVHVFPVKFYRAEEKQGEFTYIRYERRNERLTYQVPELVRHFELLMRKLRGEMVYSGKFDKDSKYHIVFKFPKDGKVTWGHVVPHSADRVYEYHQVTVQTDQPWEDGMSGTSPAGDDQPAQAAPSRARSDADSPPERQAEAPAARKAPEARASEPARPAAPAITLEDVTRIGLDYVMSEYALDMMQYTACGMAMARSGVSSDFNKARRDFIAIFPPESRRTIEAEFFSEDMKRLKDELTDRGLMAAIQKAKRGGANMGPFCDGVVGKLGELNSGARANWARLKAALARQ